MPNRHQSSPIAGERNRRILLLEKDPVQREIIREYLEMDGRYKVVDCPHLPRKSWGRLLTKTSLALLDVESAQELGARLCREIKKMAPTLPVLGMLDGEPRESRESRSEKTWDGFIGKPFAARQLQDSIESMLGP